MLTEIQIGKVSASASPANPQAARNLPITASTVEIGKVIKFSIVPVLRSSAHSRIAIAGISSR